MSRIGVLGAGSWGTALAVQFARTGHDVTLWVRHRELAETMTAERRNPIYLPEVELPRRLHPTHHLEELAGCEPVLVVVPSHGFREVLRRFLMATPSAAELTVVSCTKGIETDGARMSQVCFEEGINADRQLRFAVLGGPTFASELAAGMPALGVIASELDELATELQELLASPNFRLYTSPDVVGVELGGTTKNVIAIAAGVVVGLGLGQNTLAALITRGLHEITRLGVAYGGQVRTFSGLAGLGDLVLTCTGGLSRNRKTGIQLAEGMTLAEITGGTAMVAEGIRNTRSIAHLAQRKGVEMPITEQMRQVIYEDKAPREALPALMTRELKAEAAL